MEEVQTHRPDRRRERTRQLLRDALTALIIEKGYDAISIQDITDRANVARPTFYLHFRDKDELLFSSVRDIYEDLAQRHYQMEWSPEAILSAETVDDSDFQHIAENAEFYKVMLSKRGSITFLLQVLDYLTEVTMKDIISLMVPEGSQSRLPPGFIASFLAGAEIGVVRWWLANDMPHSPQEMALIMHHLCTRGLAWAVDMPVPPSDFRVEDNNLNK